VLLPRTEVDKAEDDIGSINSIDLQKNQKILVYMRVSHLYFEFNKDFSLHSINLSHIFKMKYETLYNTQTTMSWLQDKVRSELRDKILYYDGKAWVDQPTKVSIRDNVP